MLQPYLKPIKNLLQKRPILAIFEVTLRCNSVCGYCDLPLNQGRYEMSREEIFRVFSHLYDEGLRVVFVQGGEPLLRKDLPEILDDLSSIGLTISLITNGTKFTPDLLGRFAKHPISLSISLDTLDRQRYRTIRGADQLPLVLKGIELLNDYPHPKYLTCIVSEVNRKDVLECRPIRPRSWNDSGTRSVSLGCFSVWEGRPNTSIQKSHCGGCLSRSAGKALNSKRVF